VVEKALRQAKIPNIAAKNKNEKYSGSIAVKISNLAAMSRQNLKSK
jgi:hypothetical protein